MRPRVFKVVGPSSQRSRHSSIDDASRHQTCCGAIWRHVTSQILGRVASVCDLALDTPRQLDGNFCTSSGALRMASAPRPSARKCPYSSCTFGTVAFPPFAIAFHATLLCSSANLPATPAFHAAICSSANLPPSPRFHQCTVALFRQSFRHAHLHTYQKEFNFSAFTSLALPMGFPRM